jgi:hypothetical protein
MRKLFLAVALISLIIFTVGCNAKAPSAATSQTTTPADTTAAQTVQPGVTPSQTPAVKPTSSPTTKTTTPPAHVSGIVYYRDLGVSFPVDADYSAYSLAGTAVSISPDSPVTRTSSGYEFDNVAPGWHTINVVKDGYIPTKVSWNFVSGESYVFNIGLYKTPTAVNPRPGFINGVITWDAGGWLIDYYYQRGLFSPTYSDIVANAGGTLTTVSDPVFINVADENHVVMSNVSIGSSHWRMMNETEYTTLVTDAHSKGLQFMLWLGVMDEGKTDYSNIIYRDGARADSFWDTWFSEYEKYAVQYAAMAEKLGMEYISLGHDLGYATGGYRFSGGADDCFSRWQKLITAVRAVYHGKLAYFGYTDPKSNYYEDNDYAPGFVGLFDAVGVNIQNISDSFNPSLSELKGAVTALLDRYTSWDRPVFIMLRTPSVDGGTSFSTYIEPLLAVNQEALKHVMNVWQQADIYEAFYEVINERPVGNGQVMGIFTWGYNYLDDYLIVPDKIDGYMAMDKSGNIRDKPAEAVMKFWDLR